MKEKPILFSTPMVKAILDGRKTMTRRVVKKFEDNGFMILEPDPSYCPYGQPGDRLWVRETWRPAYDKELYCCVEFRSNASRIKPAAGSLSEDQGHRFADDCPDVPSIHAKWRPSIHMPRWASQITLEITGVRVERVQDISEQDARDEGASPITENKTVSGVFRSGFRLLWDSINAKRGYGWDANPWVWVVEFRRVTP